MKQNPQTQKIILVDRCEMDADGHGAFLKVFALGGETYRIPEKRSALWETFKSALYAEPLVATFETYMNIEYIVDAKPIADEITKLAVKNLASRIADAQTEDRNRSTGLSYAKDMVCATVITLDNLFEYAQENYEFIKGVKKGK